MTEPQVILHQPPACWGLPNMSPFCVKLETYLRMAKIPYKTAAGDFLRAPNGRVPYVLLDGKLLGDSTLIIRELKRRYGDSLDANLGPEEKARALALQRLLEDHLYYAGLWLRWSTEESWKCVREVFLSVLPPVLGPFIVAKIRKKVLASVSHQGVAEHPRETIIELAREDVQAISALLGDRPFFLGEEPTSIDATLYGFLVQQLWVPWDGPLKQFAKSLPNLEAYCVRMRERYWS